MKWKALCALMVLISGGACESRTQTPEESQNTGLPSEQPRRAPREQATRLPGRATPIGQPDSLDHAGRIRRLTRVEFEVHGTSASRTRDLTQFVRSRDGQFRYCYEDRGLTQDSLLAGEATLWVRTAASGKVDSVETTNRAWSGDRAAAAATEACMHTRFQMWRLPDENPDSFSVRVRLSSYAPASSGRPDSTR